MWKDTIRKTNILKKDYDITWKNIDIEDMQLSNIPKEWIRKEGENTPETARGTSEYSKTVNYVEFTIDEMHIEGGLQMDIRTWGVKSMRATADEIECEMLIQYEDDDNEDYRLNAGEDLDESVRFTITDIEDEDSEQYLNPSRVYIEIDMKNSTSPSNWKTKASIEWQGSY
jgi:hypothetical protein